MRHLLHRLLVETSWRHPDRVAVVDGERSLTYAELEARSNQVGHLLRDLGVARGDRVALHLDKSIESIVGLYGALKAGAAYVPLDPRAPSARLVQVARDCGARWALVDRRTAGAWPAAGAPVEHAVVLDGDAAGPVVAQPAAPVPVSPLSLDLAYILYTSGSTGSPKGVMLGHRSGLAFVEWAVETFGVREHDRLASHAPLHFDLSIFDVFASAQAGAALVLVPAPIAMLPVEVARFIDRLAVTTWYSVPSILALLAVRGGLAEGALPGLRTVLFAGEVFASRHLRRLMGLLPHARFHNLFGPTETNVCTWHAVEAPPAGDDPVPIGRPITDVDVLVVADGGRLAGPGEVGELWVRGPTVMAGYWADAERTRAALVSDPRGLPGPVYRTGDLAYRDPDGVLWFVGRRDAQVKSRGYRIELGDIEAAIHAHPAVTACAVVPVPDELVTNRLVACVEVREPVAAAELTRHCAARLPRYMVPERFVFHQQLPLTPTSKVDRQALLRGLGPAGAQAPTAGKISAAE